ncbi:MAG TPA: PHP-associated domain-containing protein [archaeon]|nr:PHP-associated domain-containing protein [archaeon]
MRIREGEILKVDLHLHSSEDSRDRVRHDAFELLEEAHSHGLDVISITNHDTVTFSHELRTYAEGLGILLIPGIELTVEGCHVLVVGELERLHSITRLDDLYASKGNGTLIIAPHPFFPISSGLGKKIYRHIELFDAIEFCHCYYRLLNFNNPALELARVIGLPLVAFSDSHVLWQLGSSYSLVRARKSVQDVLNAIRSGEIEIVVKPMNISRTLRTAWWILSSKVLSLAVKREKKPRFNWGIVRPTNSDARK